MLPSIPLTLGYFLIIILAIGIQQSLTEHGYITKKQWETIGTITGIAYALGELAGFIYRLSL